jgi:hypothetical protein
MFSKLIKLLLLKRDYISRLFNTSIESFLNFYFLIWLLCELESLQSYWCMNIVEVIINKFVTIEVLAQILQIETCFHERRFFSNFNILSQNFA